MPTYTLRNKETNETWQVLCSWNDLQEKLKDPNIEKILAFPKIVTGVGSLQSKVPDGFKDRLKEIKKTSGQNNQIKV